MKWNLVTCKLMKQIKTERPKRQMTDMTLNNKIAIYVDNTILPEKGYLTFFLKCIGRLLNRLCIGTPKDCRCAYTKPVFDGCSLFIFNALNLTVH